ncbi:MAG: antibiotic biosynthesis monooxygenase, partial [Candidatus Bathyarchaeia archaeon]
MYIVTYHYKVPSNMRKRYLELMRKTADLYAKHGCLSYEVLEDTQNKGDWLEINRF